ncbi:unnamed protein product, partial [Ectocarpus sp. 12 AP-2014]
ACSQHQPSLSPPSKAPHCYEFSWLPRRQVLDWSCVQTEPCRRGSGRDTRSESHADAMPCRPEHVPRVFGRDLHDRHPPPGCPTLRFSNPPYLPLCGRFRSRPSRPRPASAAGPPS